MKKLASAVALLTFPFVLSLHASMQSSENFNITENKAPQRIVSAGNGVTELIYALGAGDRVIAVDSTSQWPPAARRLPKLGYHKRLSPEGILAMAPTLLIGTDDMGPDATISQLESAGLQVESLPVDFTVKTMRYRIEHLAKLLGKESQGKKLWASIEKSLNEAKTLAKGRKDQPKVLFMMAMGGRTPSVSGSQTAANAMIELAGGTNVAAAHFNSYKPLSNEALMEMAPDVIIYADRGNGITPEQMLSMQPILRQTPAGKSGKVIPIDGTLLLGGLGPRTGEMAMKLAQDLYSEASDLATSETLNES